MAAGNDLQNLEHYWIGFDDCLKQYPHWKKSVPKLKGGELATVFKSDWPSALQTTLRQLLSIDCRARLRASETVLSLMSRLQAAAP